MYTVYGVECIQCIMKNVYIYANILSPSVYIHYTCVMYGRGMYGWGRQLFVLYACMQCTQYTVKNDLEPLEIY